MPYQITSANYNKFRNCFDEYFGGDSYIIKKPISESLYESRKRAVVRLCYLRYNLAVTKKHIDELMKARGYIVDNI